MRWKTVQLGLKFAVAPSQRAAFERRRNIPVIDLPDNARYANGLRLFLIRVSSMTDGVRVPVDFARPGVSHGMPAIIPSPRTSSIFCRASRGMPAAQHRYRRHERVFMVIEHI